MKLKSSVKINKKSLNDIALEAMKSAVKGKLFDISCPHCGAEISAPEGESICPNCNKLIDLTLNYKLD